MNFLNVLIKNVIINLVEVCFKISSNKEKKKYFKDLLDISCVATQCSRVGVISQRSHGGSDDRSKVEVGNGGREVTKSDVQ